MTLLDDFLWRALLGGIGVAALTGPLGCFVVWRRMAYFGDALAHGALLGVALAFALQVSLNAGTLLAYVAFALALAALESQRRLASDTLLGILSHTSLALGLVTLSFLQGLRIDLMSYLFGDILAVTPVDLAWIYGGGAVIAVVTAVLWTRLLAMTISEDVARAEGVPVGALRLALMLLVALVIVVAMKIVGILLITALLIVPAATARALARSPEQMALLASGAGMLAVLGGLGASLRWDTPSGPSIVVAATSLFLAALLVEALTRRVRRVRPARLD